MILQRSMSDWVKNVSGRRPQACEAYGVKGKGKGRRGMRTVSLLVGGRPCGTGTIAWVRGMGCKGSQGQPTPLSQTLSLGLARDK